MNNYNTVDVGNRFSDACSYMMIEGCLIKKTRIITIIIKLHIYELLTCHLTLLVFVLLTLLV